MPYQRTLALVLLTAAPLLAEEPAESILLASGYSSRTSEGSAVYRVRADGSIEPVGLHVDELGGSIEHGARGSVPSPDGKRLAFLKDDDVWVYEVDGNRVRALTSVGAPPEPPFTSVRVSIKAWSPDSRRIVYHVGHGIAEHCDGPPPPTEIRAAPYGFHEIDVETGESRPLDETKDPLDCFRRHHVAWLPDGSLLVNGDLPTPEAGARELCPEKVSDAMRMRMARLLRVSPDGKSVRPVLERAGWFTQPSLSADARWLAVHHAMKHEGAKKWSTQLLKIDLETGDVVPIAERTAWASLQGAKLSPSGRRAAYIGKEWSGQEQLTLLFVDGNELARERPGLRHDWIGETALAIRTDRMIRVIDADSGEELGRRMLVRDDR